MSLLPSTRMSRQMWISLLALGLVLWLIISLGRVILDIGWILFSALLLALALRPVAERLGHRHVPRGLTVLAIYVLLLAVLAAAGTLLAPVIGAEVDTLRANGPTLVQNAWNHLTASPLASWIPTADAVTQGVSQRLNTLLAGAVGTVAGISNLAVDLVVILILGYSLTTNTDWDSRLLLKWVPVGRRHRVASVLDDVRTRLTRWLWAQVGIALYFIVIFSAGLALLGVPFAFSLGVVGGLLGLIPYLGSFVAVLLAVFSALTVSPTLALWAAIFTVAASSFEIHVVAPFLYGQAMGLPSAVILVALVVGARLQGVVGILFAVPVAVIVAAILEEAQKNLEAETIAVERAENGQEPVQVPSHQV